MARVVYRDENYQTFYVDVNAQQPEVTIGRNPGNRVFIPAKSLSRYHAKIVYQNGRFFLYDLKSSNGTYVNNARINQQEIKPGDKIRFGDVSVEFIDETRIGGSVPPQKPVAPMSAPPTAMGGAPSAAVSAPGGMPMGAGAQGMASNRPVPPSMPGLGMPKLNAPALQVPQYASNSDLRSVSMRPISSHGSYRPTMPNQPVFDDEMAKLAAEQMASSTVGGISASAAPMGFNPNSMGFAPGGGRNLVAPPIPDGGAPINPPPVGARPAVAPSVAPLGTCDPSVAPVSFNPSSMGVPVVPGSSPIPGTIPSDEPSIGAANVSQTENDDGIDERSLGESNATPGQPAGFEQGKGDIPDQSESETREGDVHGGDGRDEGDSHAQEMGGGMSSDSNVGDFGGRSPSSMQNPSRQIRRRNTIDAMASCDNAMRRATRAPVGRASSMMSSAQGAVSRNSMVNPSSGHHAAVPVNRTGRGMQQGRRSAQRYSPRAGDSHSDALNDSQFPLEANDPSHVAETPSAHEPQRVSGGDEHDSGAHSPSGDICASGKSEIIELGDDVGFGEKFGDSVEQYLPEIDGSVPDSGIDDVPQALIRETPSSGHDDEVSEPIDGGDLPSNAFGSGAAAENAHEGARAECANGEEQAEPSRQVVEEKSDVAQAQDELPKTEPPHASAETADERAALLAEKEAIAIELGQIRAQNASIADENEALKARNAELQAEKAALQSENEAISSQLDDLRKDAANRAQFEDAIRQLTEAHEREIDDLNLAHASELGSIEAQRDELKRQVSELEEQLQTARDAATAAETKSAESEKGAACMQFVPRWNSRFNALVQYAKVFERAVEKLGVEAVEPKTTEYIRSMVDMIRFCADDLNSCNS